MTGDDLQKLRKRSGLTIAAFGRALGYEGKHNNLSRRVRRMEELAELNAGESARARVLAEKLDAMERVWTGEAPE